MEYVESARMTLADLKNGDKASIQKVNAQEKLRQRLLDMGLHKGAVIEVVKYAPLKDPLEVLIKGYHLSLRVKEAQNIEVEII